MGGPVAVGLAAVVASEQSSVVVDDAAVVGGAAAAAFADGGELNPGSGIPSRRWWQSRPELRVMCSGVVPGAEESGRWAALFHLSEQGG